MAFELRHVYLPYCIERVADGRYIVLNRWYKPVGINTREWVDYTDPYLVKLRALSPATLAKLCAPGSVLRDDKVWLYNDGCVPTDSAAHWAAYAARLATLAKLTLKE